MGETCDNCGRGTGVLVSKTHIDGTVYCARANCREAYEERTGEEYKTFGDELLESARRPPDA